MYNFFKALRAVLRFLFIGRISLVIVLLLAVLLFCVGQVTDTIISIGNNASALQFLILFVFLFLLAVLIWYLAMVFYSLAYYDDPGTLVKTAIVYVPRFLGAFVLLISGGAFIKQAIAVFGISDKSSGLPLFIFGIVVLAIGIIVCIIFIIRMLFFKPEEPIIVSRESGDTSFQPFKRLSPVTRRIVLIDLFASIVLFALLVIMPLTMSHVIGNAITVLVICLCVYLPVFYMIAYLGSRIKFPLFFVLFVIVALSSFSNGNKNVRILDKTQVKRKYDLAGYFYNWYEKRNNDYGAAKKTVPPGGIPMIMVLSEGGGIRAAYYSGCLLSRISDEYPALMKYLFGIQGVSGGSFGAAVFDGLLKFHLEHPEAMRAAGGSMEKSKSGMVTAHSFPGAGKYPIAEKAAQVLGQDYLSPVIMGMLTREVVQLFWPLPIDSFDYAKIFEKAWETEWSTFVTFTGENREIHDTTFSDPISSLWNTKVNDNLVIPVLFLNSTNVETGRPFTVSPLMLPDDSKTGMPHLGITNDFYFYTGNKDVRVSTTALLSARFPYIGPAGTIIGNKRKIGFVDGGYFDNTGANFANDIYLYLEDRVLRDKKTDINVQPIVIYLKNGSDESAEKTSPEKSMLYQLTAPLATCFNIRDAFTVNGLDKMNILLSFDDLEIITLPLTDQNLSDSLSGQVGIKLRNPQVKTASGDSREGLDKSAVQITPEPVSDNPGKNAIPLPLGWALSKTAQAEIDERIDDIMKALANSKPFKELIAEIAP
jgi:hypothetical protein